MDAGGSDGQLFTFTLITTGSSKRLSWLHSRMPVVLRTPDALEAWLSSSSAFKLSVVSKLCVPYNGEDLSWHPVTHAMSKLGFEGPECCKDTRKRGIGAFFKQRNAVGTGCLADAGGQAKGEKNVSGFMSGEAGASLQGGVKVEGAACDAEADPENEMNGPEDALQSGEPVRWGSEDGGGWDETEGMKCPIGDVTEHRGTSGSAMVKEEVMPDEPCVRPTVEDMEGVEDAIHAGARRAREAQDAGGCEAQVEKSKRKRERAAMSGLVPRTPPSSPVKKMRKSGEGNRNLTIMTFFAKKNGAQ